MFFIQMKKNMFFNVFFILECFYVKVLHYYLANVELHYTIIFG